MPLLANYILDLWTVSPVPRAACSKHILQIGHKLGGGGGGGGGGGQIRIGMGCMLIKSVIDHDNIID